MAALSMVSAISMLGSAFNTWKDPDLSWGEKISSISMSLMFAMPMLCHGLKEWNKLLQISTILANTRALAEEKVLGVILKEKGAIGFLRMAKMLENQEDKEKVEEYFYNFCAGSVVVAIPITLLFIKMQNFYVEGITGGAVKG